MEEGSDTIIAVLIVLVIIGVILLAILGGAIKTFQRNWIAALVLLVCVFPVWVIWAIIEVFTGEIKASNPIPIPIQPSAQNVQVTVVNQLDGVKSKNSENFVGKSGNKLSAGSVLIDEDTDFNTPKLMPIDTKICPFCAEEIKLQATFCRYCKKDI